MGSENNIENLWMTKTPEVYVKREKLITLLFSKRSDNFTVYFTKKDASKRVMYASISDLNNNGIEIPLIDAIHDKYINCVGIIEDGIRKINIETVEYITIGNDLYKVID